MKKINLDLFTKEELVDYIMYLKRKVIEYEKYYHVEIEIREPCQSDPLDARACEVIKIPPKKMVVDISKISKVKEVFKNYL
jgi:hypothetical protein